MYSIIDVETTGGRAQDHKVTEIAIINFNGREIEEVFSTLVNPERPIPYGITHLTGIDDSMVSSAPKFYEIAKKIVLMTQGRWVVAHNTHFDLSFLKREFMELGHDYRRKKLCTVRLARKALPGHASYSLGRLCQGLGIPMNGRHRVLGDATATLELFQRILESGLAVEEEAHEVNWPPNFDRKALEQVKEKMGVYQLWDREGHLLYVGRSLNMNKRVMEHLRVSQLSHRQMEFKNAIAHVTGEETGSELVAALLENYLIKQNRPPFNNALNRVRFRWAMVAVQGADGRTLLKIKKAQGQDQALILFCGRRSGERFIEWIYEKAFGVLPLSPEIGPLSIPLEEAERKLWSTLRRYLWPGGDFAAVAPGRHWREKSVVVVRGGEIKGYAFVGDHEALEDVALFPLSNDRDSQILLMQALRNGKARRYPLNSSASGGEQVFLYSS